MRTLELVGTESAEPRSRPDRVAVVAVHGVGDQARGESARAVAHLLQRLRRADGGNAYGAVQETSLSLATARVAVPDGFQSGDPGIAEADRQLRGYVHDDAPYETSCLSTVRLDDTGAPAVDIHVYELHWADLSRLQGSIFRILGELYQLVFHLPYLGRRAIDDARRAAKLAPTSSPGAGALNVLGTLQRLVTFLGAVVAPILNVAVVLAGVAALSTLVGRERGQLALQLVALLVVLFISLAMAGVLGSARLSPRFVLGGLLVTAVAGIVAASFFELEAGQWLRDQRIVAIGAMLVGAGAAAIPIVRYAQRPRTALTAAALSTALVVGTFAHVAYSPAPTHFGHSTSTAGSYASTGPMSPKPEVPRASTSRAGTNRVTFAAVRTLEVTFAALSCAWSLIVFTYLSFSIVGAMLSVRARLACDGGGIARRREAERCLRAIATARLTTSLSLLIFLTLSVALIAVVSELLSTRLHLDADYVPWIPWIFFTRSTTMNSFILTLSEFMITPVGPLVMYLIVIAAAVFAVPLLPSAASELLVPRTRRWAALFNLGVAAAGARFASFLVVVALAVYALGVMMMPIPVGSPVPVSWATTFETLFLNPAALIRLAMQGVGQLLAGTAGTLLIVQGPLRRFSVGFRSMLDIALDVDNYLREGPPKRSLRGAISARLASLLRHVEASGYDRVVFVAHSQGTVIVADHLRFLHATGRDAERPPALRLFTMGSPLRQLYAARFPHLYRWAEGEDGHGPDPAADLGIATWVNAFRTGDYVGRALFSANPAGVIPADDPGFVRDASPLPATPARDVWVGYGAHTHYWDKYAPVVARELDRLIGS